MRADVLGLLPIPALAAMFACALIYATAPAGSARGQNAAAGAAVACAIASGACALDRNWFGTVANAISAVIWFAVWWRTRRRRRALKAIGNKARARLAALAAALKDATRGARPVLRPVHGGAS